MSTTIRLTVAQALVRFLAAQYSERDGVEQRLIAGCFGIFGHGNVPAWARRCCRPRCSGSTATRTHPTCRTC